MLQCGPQKLKLVDKRFPLYIKSHTENKGQFKKLLISQSCVSKKNKPVCQTVVRVRCPTIHAADYIKKYSWVRAKGRPGSQTAAHLGGKAHSLLCTPNCLELLSAYCTKQAAETRGGGVEEHAL